LRGRGSTEPRGTSVWDFSTDMILDW
jgi:hypothetical protein